MENKKAADCAASVSDACFKYGNKKHGKDGDQK